MADLTLYEILGIWVAAGMTLAIYSFLYKDNPFYKLAENIYIGVSTGYIIVIAINDAIKPIMITPLMQPEGEPFNFMGLILYSDYVVIVPGILGLLMFTRFFQGISWLSRLTLAFAVGYGTGVIAPNNIQAYLIRHTGATIKPFFDPSYFTFTGPTIALGLITLVLLVVLIVLVQKGTFKGFGPKEAIFTIVLLAFGFLFLAIGSGLERANFKEVCFNIIMLLGVVSVLFYFFFSIEHKKTLKGVSKMGIFYLMVFFGAAFGYTVMGRVSLAIGRIRFLIIDWIYPLIGL